jgi:predicted dehydrogenase
VRSIFPSLEYVNVQLVATCDPQLEQAKACAKRYGADAAYSSLREAIKAGGLDAVLLVVGPGQHPELACEALDAGLHVWLEKPPSFDVAGVDRMIAAQKRSGKTVVVGFKKAFMPGTRRMRSFIESGRLGAVRTIQARFPMNVPSDGEAVLRDRRFTNWLGNGVHPLGFLAFMAGRPDSLTVTRAKTGGGFIVFEYANGIVANLHLAEGHGVSGPMERYEIVCERGHMILNNNVELRVYRPGYPFDYSKGADFAEGGEDVAALIYEPQHTLSVLSNKAVFMQGFVQEIDEFVKAVQSGEAPICGTLAQARIVMECYEAALLCKGERMHLQELPCNKLVRVEV